VVTADAQQLYARRFATESHDNPDGLLRFIRQCVRGPLDRIHELTGLKPQQVESRIKAIGIAFPGPTDFEKGVVLDASNFRIRNFPLVERLRDTFDIPTYMDNDVNLGVLGEAWKGAARGYDNIVGIMIGTGIGGGLIINGEIYRGQNRTAGEIGHMMLDRDSEIQCGCKQYGCFEALASRKAMARDLHRRKAARGLTDRLWAENNLLSNQIAHYYKTGDLDALAVVNGAAEFCVRRCSIF
jgi:glucokinase